VIIDRSALRLTFCKTALLQVRCISIKAGDAACTVPTFSLCPFTSLLGAGLLAGAKRSIAAVMVCLQYNRTPAGRSRSRSLAPARSAPHQHRHRLLEGGAPQGGGYRATTDNPRVPHRTSRSTADTCWVDSACRDMKCLVLLTWASSHFGTQAATAISTLAPCFLVLKCRAAILSLTV
jgi:hypothetical protein